MDAETRRRLVVLADQFADRYEAHGEDGDGGEFALRTAKLIRDLLAALPTEPPQHTLNDWHRRAQKAEAELAKSAEQRDREGKSVGRSLAAATWRHYKDRAEAAEAVLAALPAEPPKDEKPKSRILKDNGGSM